MRDTCRVCTAPLTPSGTGRPPAYCSVPCRRAAELAIKRQDRRIERLMVQTEACRLRQPELDRTYVRIDIGPPAHNRERLAHLEQLIAEAETSMRHLMGDTE